MKNYEENLKKLLAEEIEEFTYEKREFDKINGTIVGYEYITSFVKMLGKTIYTRSKIPQVKANGNIISLPYDGYTTLSLKKFKRFK